MPGRRLAKIVLPAGRCSPSSGRSRPASTAASAHQLPGNVAICYIASDKPCGAAFDKLGAKSHGHCEIRETMTEIWLHNNRRALAFGLILPGLLLAIGIAMATLQGPVWLRAAGGVVALVGLLGVAIIARQLWQPRLAYDERHLLVYLQTGPACRVPIEMVEGFLLGQGPTLLPGKRYDRAEAATVVIRLADSAIDWADRETKPALGRWCGGYITLRGTWCEPLSVDLVQRLNRRLAEVNRSADERSGTVP